MISKGQFREDLYYRLNVVPIQVPSLRSILEDIPLLSHHFINKYNLRYKLNKSLGMDIIEAMMKYDWPGNIRQLENLVERLVVTTGPDLISLNSLPMSFLIDNHKNNDQEQAIILNHILPMRQAIETIEQLLLEKTFTMVNSCYKAAEMLEVNPSTISRKARKYGVRIDDVI